MTTKECLEDLIKLMDTRDILDYYDRITLINTLHRGQGDSS
ncbi:unnamed protein product [marine sediment metagenome]|uniref:Uncharacterized protein n=1 Tax=marine sediment metagenome TaxID=412755 RepID=X1VPK9_9ZZZZ